MRQQQGRADGSKPSLTLSLSRTRRCFAIYSERTAELIMSIFYISRRRRLTNGPGSITYAMRPRCVYKFPARVARPLACRNPRTATRARSGEQTGKVRLQSGILLPAGPPTAHRLARFLRQACKLTGFRACLINGRPGEHDCGRSLPCACSSPLTGSLRHDLRCCCSCRHEALVDRRYASFVRSNSGPREESLSSSAWCPAAG